VSSGFPKTPAPTTPTTDST